MKHFSYKIENEFVRDYYEGRESKYYSPDLPKIPEEILELYNQGRYLEYTKTLICLREELQSR